MRAVARDHARPRGRRRRVGSGPDRSGPPPTRRPGRLARRRSPLLPLRALLGGRPGPVAVTNGGSRGHRGVHRRDRRPSTCSRSCYFIGVLRARLRPGHDPPADRHRRRSCSRSCSRRTSPIRSAAFLGANWTPVPAGIQLHDRLRDGVPRRDASPSPSSSRASTSPSRCSRRRASSTRSSAASSASSRRR